jgi:hypothetical protein
MATKKTTSRRASPTKKATPPTPAGLATQWTELEAQLREALGPRTSGQYPTELEPLSMTFEHTPDLGALLPDDYQRFVDELGYRWVNTGKKGLAFLPPRWRMGASQGMGEPGRQWTTVREEREAGRHDYRFVMFASEDLNDVNGYCFGKSAQGDALVVWSVEDSLPTLELGPFTAWLAKKLAALGKQAATVRKVRDDALGEPLGLLMDSYGEAAAQAREQGAAALLAGHPRNTKHLFLHSATLRVLPDLVGEFTELESLSATGVKLTRLSGELGRLTKLKNLNLSRNPELTSLPAELAHLQSLESLALDGTGLSELPETLLQLPKLRYLDLKATPLTSLPGWLGRMPALKRLVLRQTRVRTEQIEALKQARPELEVELSD